MASAVQASAAADPAARDGTFKGLSA
jgi:hypothetical protein